MNNFAGLVVMAFGILILIIGIRGTQKATFGGLWNAIIPSSGGSTPTQPSSVDPGTDGKCQPGWTKLSTGKCADLRGI